MSGDLDLTNESDVEKDGPKGRPLDDHDRLGFAKYILLVCAGLLLIASILYACPWANVEATKKIFETFAVVLPPIVTLVLGYFFSKR